MSGVRGMAAFQRPARRWGGCPLSSPNGPAPPTDERENALGGVTATAATLLAGSPFRQYLE